MRNSAVGMTTQVKGVGRSARCKLRGILHAGRVCLRVTKTHTIAPLLAENNDFVLSRQPAKGPIEKRRPCTYLLFQAGQRQFAVVI